ncbi:MAG TPA: STAS domain-containing protein [Flavobacteriales bacterium]|nr:STAS domain-containing protein [Flavobacteriales bacterium]
MTVTERPPFDLEINDHQGVPVFHMKGRLMDQQQADRLMQALDLELAKGPSSVVLDMGELQYMNSTGLNILISVLTTTRNKGGDTLIARVSHSVRQLFVVTKLDSVFIITDTVEVAIAKIKG